MYTQLAESVVMANWLVQSVNAHCFPCVPPSVTYRILKIPARATDPTLAYSWASSQSKHFCHVQLFFVGPGLFFVHACSDAPQIRTIGRTRCEFPLPWQKNKINSIIPLVSHLTESLRKSKIGNCVFPSSFIVSIHTFILSVPKQS